MITKDKKLIKKDLRTGKAKLELGIDQRELEHIIFHRAELQIIE